MSSLERVGGKIDNCWIAALLWLAVLLSSLSVVSVSQQCRQLYATLALLQHKANQMQVEWGQYLLEQSSWASFSRIEQRATNELGLVAPGADRIELVTP